MTRELAIMALACVSGVAVVALGGLYIAFQITEVIGSFRRRK